MPDKTKTQQLSDLEHLNKFLRTVICKKVGFWHDREYLDLYSETVAQIMERHGFDCSLLHRWSFVDENGNQSDDESLHWEKLQAALSTLKTRLSLIANTPALDAESMKIMQYLAKHRRKTCLGVDIATGTELSEKTVKTKIAELIGYEFVHRPNGKNKGATLTARGGLFLSR